MAGILRVWLTAVLASISVWASAQGGLAALTQQATEFLPVNEAYQLEIEQVDPTTLRLYWQIADGYYLYKHRFKAKLEDSSGPLATTFEFPEAKAKTDEFFGDVEVYYTQADLRLTTEQGFGQVRLAISSQGCADAGLCYPPETEIFTIDGNSGTVTRGEPDSPLGGGVGGNTSTDGPSPSGDASADSMGLFAAIGFAMLGGLILNAMPCVFPILSLKVLSFATGDPQSHHRHAWWYLLGVVVSFVAVAAVLIALQSAGQLIGWGFQLQSPGFVIGLAYLFTAMGLSLSGVVQFGTSLMGLGSGLASRGGYQGSFFTGVLAVVVASPCTAPFMGSALGFALTQPPALALLVFAGLGVGMAAPMVLLSYSQAARDRLPKPGAWMETLKELIAFPLYATAVWLLWVAGKQAGVDTMAAALAGVVTLALGLFLVQRGRLQQVVGVAAIALALGLATVRGAPPSAEADAPRADGTVSWSNEALAGLQREGVPVFVDVTADWCITCLANEQAVLFTDDTIKAFEDAGVVYMVADWTNYDPVIGEFVKSHGRNGIPLYVMYPAGEGAKPFLLPQLLTSRIVREALERATSS